jgi:hypothetical protein
MWLPAEQIMAKRSWRRVESATNNNSENNNNTIFYGQIMAMASATAATVIMPMALAIATAVDRLMTVAIVIMASRETDRGQAQV